MQNNPIMPDNKPFIDKFNLFKIDPSKINDEKLLNLINQTKSDYQDRIDRYDSMINFSRPLPESILNNFKLIGDKLRELYDPYNYITNNQLLQSVLIQNPQPQPQQKQEQQYSRYNRFVRVPVLQAKNALNTSIRKGIGMLMPNLNKINREVRARQKGGKYTKKRKSNKRKTNKRYSSLKL
jgi:hypothetical protein